MKKILFVVLSVTLAAWAVPILPVHADIGTGLLAYWNFDEGSGTVAADSSGNGYTGTLQNGPMWTAGQVNQALSFDGNNDVVSVSSALDIPSLPFSIGVWVNPTNYNSWREIFSKRDSYSASSMRIDLELNSGSGRVKLHQAASAVEFNYTPPTNVWTHLVVIATPSGTSLYVNGALQQILGVITLGTKATAAVRIGDSGQGDLFLGKIDELRIYGRALSGADVTELYNFGGTPAFNFTLTNNGDKSVIQGGSVTNAITASVISGTTTPVSFSASGLPTGASASFSPTSCSPSCGTTMTINTGGSTPFGTSNIVVTGIAGTTTHTTAFNLTVTNILDITPPTVSIISPLDGTVASSTVIISASASDNVGVVGVQFKINGANFGAEDTNVPYQISWDTALNVNGTYILTAVARDTADNTATSASISVTVYNVPDITPPSIPTNLSATTVSSNQINLAWSSSTDDVGVAGYKVFRNSAYIATALTATYSNTGLTASTTYSYAVSAFDAAGNESAQSESVSTSTFGQPPIPSPIPFTLNIVSNSLPAIPWGKTIADIDGDGYLDAVVGGQSGPVVWYNYPSWTKYTIDTGGGSASGSWTVDIDGDGDTDIIMGETLYLNPRPAGNPKADSWVKYLFPNWPGGHDVRAGQLDADGKMDVVIRGEGNSELNIYKQNSPTSFAYRLLDPGFGLNGLSLTDVDGDGLLDIVVSRRWMKNPGDILNGTWVTYTYTSSTSAQQYATVDTADMNGDGLIDIVLSPSEVVGNIVWYENPSNPLTNSSWTEHIIGTGFESAHALRVVDMNNDGRLDVVTSEFRGAGRTAIFQNLGGALSWYQQVVATNSLHNVVVGDIDADGDQDLFGTDSTTAEMWRNDLIQ